MFFKKLTCSLLAASVCAAMATSVFADTEADIANAQALKSAAEASLAEADSSIGDMKAEQSQLMKYLSELNAQILALDTSLTEISGKMDTKETEIEMSKAAVERAKLEEQKQYTKMKNRIQYMYENGSSDFLVDLLNSESVGELLDKADHFSEVTTYDRRKLDAYQDAKQVVIEQEKALEKEQQSLEELKKDYEAKQAEVEALADSTEGKISEYSDSIASAEFNRLAISKKIEDQTKLLDSLTEKLAREKAEREEAARKAAEAERLAAEKAAAEKAAAEKAAAEKKAAEEKAAAEKAAAEKAAAEEKAAEEKALAEKKAAEVAAAAEEAAARKAQEENEAKMREAQAAAAAHYIEAIERSSGSGEAHTVRIAEDQLTYLGTFKLTAYCPCAKCCGWENGPTASGVYPTVGHTIAMAGVPFGTRLLINGTVYTVEDRGTPYGHADIFMSSHGTCLSFGVSYAEVYQVNG
ncbi:MAG: hypothetical protein K6E30_09330 [Lachnospiraceae bacterium]|nr:hypothetical protein [Lachnospiraceae bacterium]